MGPYCITVEQELHGRATQCLLCRAHSIREKGYLTKVTLEGAVHCIGLAGEGGGRVILGGGQGVAAVHPVMLTRPIINFAT